METETKKTFSFGSEDLKNAVIEGDSNFFKAEIGKLYIIDVDKSKEIEEKIVSFDNKLSKRFDIHIFLEGKSLIWSIGKRNLKLINDSKGTKFNVLRTKENYNIIPLN